MTLLTYVRRHAQGSAKSALPFVLSLFLTANAGATMVSTQMEQAHLDAGGRLMLIKPAALDAFSEPLGFPNTGGTMLLWGAGGTVAPGLLRAQVSAWTGGLSATQNGKTTSWDLNLGALTLEQRYPMGSFLVTAGTSFEMGELAGALDQGTELTRVLAQLYGFGVNVGGRWPAQTPLGFFARAGYLWLGGSGIWHGPLAGAPTLGSSQFDLSGANLTVQLELGF